MTSSSNVHGINLKTFIPHEDEDVNVSSFQLVFDTAHIILS